MPVNSDENPKDTQQVLGDLYHKVSDQVSRNQIMLDPDSRIIVELSDPSLQTNLETDSKGMYAITLVDTGATFNVINEVCWEQLGCPELTPVDMVMIGVDRRTVPVLGATPELVITLGPTNEHRRLKAKFLVIRM